MRTEGSSGPARAAPWKILSLALGVMLLSWPGQGRADHDPDLQELQKRLEALEHHHQEITGHPPHLDDPGPADPVECLRLRIEVLERLVAENRPATPATTPVSFDGGELPSAGKDLRLSTTWINGFLAETADQFFRVHIGGRAEFDNSWFTQDDNLLIGPIPTSRTQDGTLFRRVRLRADGTMWDFIDFVVEVNFANIQDASNVDNQPVQVGSVGLTSVYLTFRDVPMVGNLRAGHFKAPVGLERDSSSNAWYYLERSSFFDAFLGPNNYQDGVEIFDSYLDDRMTFATAFTRIGSATIQSFGFGAGDGDYAWSVRLTALPVCADDGRVLVHLGAGYQHQALVDHQFDVASRPLIRSGSGSGFDTPNLVFTGTFFTPNGADLVVLEAASVYGPLSLSGEFGLARVTDVFDTLTGSIFAGPRGDATLSAFYVEGGYFLTPGDYRRYDRKTGTWDRTIPQENFVLTRSDGHCHCKGAVQLLARYTYLDLVSGSPVLTPTSGGARAGLQKDVTLGINWYLNPQVWVMVNYVWTQIDSVVPGASGDLHYAGVRMHVDF